MYASKQGDELSGEKWSWKDSELHLLGAQYMSVRHPKKPGSRMNSFPERPIIAAFVFQVIRKMYVLLIHRMVGTQYFIRRHRATGRVLQL